MATSVRGRLGTRTRKSEVRIVDTPTARVHHPADLVGVVLALLGIVAVCVLAVYAQGTTQGLTDDVREFSGIVRRLLFMPVAVLEGIITFIAPLAVLTELALRRLLRQAFEAIAAAVAGTLLALLAMWLITRIDVSDLTAAFSVWTQGRREVTIPALLTGTAALLTAAGTRSSRRTLPWSWNLLFLGLGIATITALVTLPGALVTVLLGRATGLAIRYLSGVQSERAYGEQLVTGLRRAGFDPVDLVRVRDASDDDPLEDAVVDDAASSALTRIGDHRVYALRTSDGARRDVVVLDGDRQVMGVLQRLWRSIRLRGLEGRGVVSLRQAAERAALLSHAAWTAGVCTPRPLGLAEAEDSMLLVQEHVSGAVALRDLGPDEVTDAVLDAVWRQLATAHAAGIAHRAITADCILLDRESSACSSPGHADDADGPHVVLTGWEQGDVASSDLARRFDVAQLLAVLTVVVGPERAVESAARVLPGEDLATTGPLLQAVVLPTATREDVKARKELLPELRRALLARLPETVVAPERLVRFGARTVLMTTLGIVAFAIVVTTVSFQEIADAVRDASPWWMAVAFGLGLATFVGGALAMVAFAPVRLGLWRTTLTQAAAAFVSLMAPAGIGPAALNLRLLTRRGVRYALAVASVGLVQLSQLIVTIVFLVVLSLVSGQESALQQLPSTTVLVALGLALAVLAATLLVPAVRSWAARRLVPVWRQTWPRFVQLLSEPRRFAVAAFGNAVVMLGYVGAFYACLAAFGREMSLIDLAIIYLVGNAAGAAVPTPGGLGAVEFALVGGLTATGGVPLGIATSVVVLFRALTFWGRLPVGWLAMRSLQRSGEL